MLLFPCTARPTSDEEEERKSFSSNRFQTGLRFARFAPDAFMDVVVSPVCFPSQTLAAANGDSNPVDFISLTKGLLIRVCELLGAESGRIHEGELAAFLSYAIAYPHNFLSVIDSYSVGW